MFDCAVQKNPLFPPPCGRSLKIPGGEGGFQKPQRKWGGGRARKKKGVGPNRQMCECEKYQYFLDQRMAKTG